MFNVRMNDWMSLSQDQLSVILVKLDHVLWRKCSQIFPLMSSSCSISTICDWRGFLEAHRKGRVLHLQLSSVSWLCSERCQDGRQNQSAQQPHQTPWWGVKRRKRRNVTLMEEAKKKNGTMIEQWARVSDWFIFVIGSSFDKDQTARKICWIIQDGLLGSDHKTEL